jgi:hypothetical protein
MMDAKARKTWISIVVAAVIIIGLLAVTIVGGTAFFIYSHVNAKLIPQESAEQEFTIARARFSNQQPLIELTADDEPVLHRKSSAPRHEIQSLHALVYDGRAHKLTHLDIPGWLLKLMSAGGRIRIANLDVLDDDTSGRVTLEDLERHGPGLVLDLKRARGSQQILLWTE